MPNKPLFSALESIGLHENEANLYLASLSMGPSTILKLSRASGMKRTTIYSVVESLKQKGLMSVEHKGLKKLYTPEDPQKLSAVLQSKQKQLSSALPELSSLFNLKGDEATIKYYEGLEGIKTVYESLIQDIKPGEKYMVISDQEKWLSLDSKYFQDFLERRAKLNIDIRMLLQDSKTAQEFKKFQKNFNLQLKILPSRTSLVTNLVITPQKVVIHQLINPLSAIVIENKSTIQMHQQLFEIIWGAKE
jgi:sugar-specific transcriptional regulator TrmB